MFNTHKIFFIFRLAESHSHTYLYKQLKSQLQAKEDDIQRTPSLQTTTFRKLLLDVAASI